MSDLDLKEQNHVRTALRYLHRRAGTSAAVADGLRSATPTLEQVLSGRRPVSAGLALRVARLLNAPMDDLLSGQFLPGACPKCGHVPDFADEPTQVEHRLGGGLRAVK